MCFTLSSVFALCLGFFFFKQKTAYEMRISDWSSDVCSSDLQQPAQPEAVAAKLLHMTELDEFIVDQRQVRACQQTLIGPAFQPHAFMVKIGRASCRERVCQYV